MRERPILFSGPMVRAILDGKKTQTRRVLDPQPPDWIDELGFTAFTAERHISGRGRWTGSGRNPEYAEKFFKLRYAHGDRLWVREAWATRLDRDHLKPSELDPKYDSPFFWADPETCNTGCGGAAGRRRASIHLPRWASRLRVEVTLVRGQRLQEITAEDAVAEGAPVGEMLPGSVNGEPAQVVAMDPRVAFAWLWNSIRWNSSPWASNPWVLAYTFKRVA